MAKCDFCDKEMTDEQVTTCEGGFMVYADGTKLPRLVYEHDRPGRCHDCNVSPGGYHHPGCDMEICPRCGGQLISCDCEKSDSGWEVTP